MGITQSPVDVGHYLKYSVHLNGEDITKICNNVEVYQDIHANTWTGEIVLVDSNNLSNTIKAFIGADVVISITTKQKIPCGGVYQKEYKFTVFNISDKILVKKNIYGYKCQLISPEAFQDLAHKRLQKTFIGKTPDSVVKWIITKFMGWSIHKIDADPHVYDLQFLNWSAMYSINWLTKFAFIPNVGADFLFYQWDNDGVFNWRSLEAMYGDSSGYKFIHREQNWRKVRHKENDDSFIKINKYKFRTTMNGLLNTIMGAYGSKTLVHDIIDKKIRFNDYIYSQDNVEDRVKKPYLGGIPESPNSSIIYTPKQTTNSPSTQNMHETQKGWVSSRKCNQRKHSTNRLFITVAGQSCYWKALGKTVEITLPTQTDKLKGNDKYYTGTYLVSAIKHTIAGKKYLVNFELSKKRLVRPIG